MKKNDDQKVIVLDIHRYLQLLSIAGIGDQEMCGQTNLEEIERHARKFNPHLRPAHEKELKEILVDRAATRRERAKARRILTNRTIHSWPHVSTGYGEFRRTHRREPRVFYYLYHHEKLAFPIHVLGTGAISKGLLRAGFLIAGHCRLAGQHFNPFDCRAASVAETKEQIPEDYTLVED